MKIIKNPNTAWFLATIAMILIVATLGFYVSRSEATGGYIMASGNSSILQVGGGAVIGLDLTASNNGLIVKGGKVGLGTTAPTAGLDVRSSLFYLANSGGTSMNLENITGDVTMDVSLGKILFKGYESGDNTHRVGAAIEAYTSYGWGDTNGLTDAPTSLIFYANNSNDVYDPTSSTPDLVITRSNGIHQDGVGIGGWPIDMCINGPSCDNMLSVFGKTGIDGSLVVSGALTAGSVSAGNGLSGTVSVRNAAGTGSCNLVFSGGILTSETCP